MKKLLMILFMIGSVSSFAKCKVMLSDTSYDSNIVAKQMNKVKKILTEKGYEIKQRNYDFKLELYAETFGSFRECLYCDTNQLVRGGTHAKVSILNLLDELVYKSSASSTKFLGIGKKKTSRKEYLSLVNSIPACSEL